MSYDIDVIKVEKEIPLENTNIKAEAQTIVHSSNYTSNICEMLEACVSNLQKEKLVNCWYSHWTECVCDDFSDEGKNIKLMIKELKANPEIYKKYNPENGWGSYETVIEWLSKVEKYKAKGYKIVVDW